MTSFSGPGRAGFRACYGGHLFQGLADLVDGPIVGGLNDILPWGWRCLTTYGGQEEIVCKGRWRWLLGLFRRGLEDILPKGRQLNLL